MILKVNHKQTTLMYIIQRRGVVKKWNRPPNGIWFCPSRFVILTDRRRIPFELDHYTLFRWRAAQFSFIVIFIDFFPVFWAFLHKISSDPLLNQYRMVELDEIFHLIWRCQGKKVGNHVISSIYGPKPTIFGGFSQYSEHFSTKSVLIQSWIHTEY
jgi:hypothetical protein